MEMNDLDYIMLEIFDLFNDFYCNVGLMVWATKEDALASLVVPETPTFDPLQCRNKSDSSNWIPIDFTFGQHSTSTLQMSKETVLRYSTYSYCDYLILPNSVELLMLEN